MTLLATGRFGWLVDWDRSTFLAFNHSFGSAALDRFMPAITDLGLGGAQACIVITSAIVLGIVNREFTGTPVWPALVKVFYRRRAWISPLLLAFAISGLASTAIKNSFERDRPWWFYEKEHAAHRSESITVRTVQGVYPLKVRGFPSGHTATTFAMATTVTILFGRRRRQLAGILGAWALAMIIAFSRIYLASHWPLDVIGGAIIGTFSGCIAVVACRRLARPTDEINAPADPRERGLSHTP